MKLEDITFLNSDYPIFKHTVSPSKVTLSLLTSLFNLSDFVEELDAIIDEYGIREPHDISELDTNFKNVSAWYKFMRDSFDPIMLQFNLPEVYRYRFFLLVQFHVFIDIPEDAESGFIYIENVGEIARYIKELEDAPEQSGAIMISNVCSKKELINWINANWDEMQKYMKDELPVRPKAGKVYKNIAIAQEAYELKKTNKSYEEISDILMEKYPENQAVCDPVLLKTIVSRHINRVKKFSLNFPTLED